jgi:hypothetical protein
MSFDTVDFRKEFREKFEQAKEMEKQQIIISDEEIEEMLFHHSNEYAYGFKDAIKWYREKLKAINDKTNR